MGRGRRLSLGHTRLAIIDLSPGGAQPMTSRCGRYTISFNGEIFNYRELRDELRGLGHEFRSESDTEVLLAAWARWGVPCLRRLVGMFAFAVADSVEGTLTLARDAFGIKPLFYACDAEGVGFASEMPAMLALVGGVRSLNIGRAFRYIEFREEDVGFETFVDGISHLPPAHVARIDLRAPKPRVNCEQWWRPSIREDCNLSFEQAADKFRHLFLDTVRLHLRADVPLGVALSGGIDSSAIACAMRLIEPDADIHAFTYADERSHENEEDKADIVASSIGAVMHKVRIEAADLDRDYDDLVWIQGEPFLGTTMYAQYCVMRAARQAGIVVVLEGQGADELLGGYVGYPGALLRSMVERLECTQAIAHARSARSWPACGGYRPWRSLGAAMAPQWLRRRIATAKASRRRQRCGLAGFEGVRAVDLCRRIPTTTAEGKGRRLMEELRTQLMWDGLPQLLRYGDRAAMRFSVENRVPFCTIPLAEFALSLPEHYLVSETGETKRILRAAMRGIVPDRILDERNKVNFRTPTGSWIMKGILGRFRQGRYEGRAHNGPGLDALVSQATENAAGSAESQLRAWRLLNLVAWQAVVLDRRGEPPRPPMAVK